MMNAVVKPYHEMCLNSSELIVPRDTYQRALHPARVARIAKEFDERVLRGLAMTNPGAITVLAIARANRSCSAGPGCPLPCIHIIFRFYL